jgi:NADH:ubiquinone oxidoreductase subunit 6 (subunit J)
VGPGQRVPVPTRLKFEGAMFGYLLLAILVFSVMAYGLLDYFGSDALDQDRAETQLVANTEQVSDSIFGQYMVPFQAIAVLLFACMVGAIALARKD